MENKKMTVSVALLALLIPLGIIQSMRDSKRPDASVDTMAAEVAENPTESSTIEPSAIEHVQGKIKMHQIVAPSGAVLDVRDGLGFSKTEFDKDLGGLRSIEQNGSESAVQTTGIANGPKLQHKMVKEKDTMAKEKDMTTPRSHGAQSTVINPSSFSNSVETVENVVQGNVSSSEPMTITVKARGKALKPNPAVLLDSSAVAIRGCDDGKDKKVVDIFLYKKVVKADTTKPATDAEPTKPANATEDAGANNAGDNADQTGN